jgi:hypothetical protein
MKAALKALLLMTLLICRLAPGAVLPPVASGDAACPQHMTREHGSAGQGSRPHLPCCKSNGCLCLQLPASTSSMSIAMPFVPRSEAVPVRSLRSPPPPTAKFFRPPI